MSDISFACPECKEALVFVADSVLHCPVHDVSYHNRNGIWQFLPHAQQMRFSEFVNDYEKIRRAEGRGSNDPHWYRQLPYDRTSAFQKDWRIRARSYETLIKNVIMPAELSTPELNILDLGAGNGWLSNRLAERGHNVVAVDLLVNADDGLGAHHHYAAEFVPVQAAFDYLPIHKNHIDLVIYNASLHYATDYTKTLSESQRILKPYGKIVILDSPVYHDASSGQQMVKEREAYFSRHFGTPSNAIESEHYLTYARLDALASALNLRWQRHTPFYGLRWMLRPLKARVRGHREPAQFHVIVGERT